MRAYIGTKIVMAEPQEKEGKEGYKVVYKDGYTSWSPKDVFEEAYHVTNNMTFGEAVEALKKGRRVSREGWNGKRMYLFLADGKDLSSLLSKESYEFVSSICMKTAQDTIVVGWLASQTDMLSEDWVIVE